MFFFKIFKFDIIIILLRNFIIHLYDFTYIYQSNNIFNFMWLNVL